LFNIENAVAAAEAVRLLQVADPAIAAGLSAAGQVAGRFEVVTHGHPHAPTVIVDYSHTPSGIEQVLRSVAAITPAATRCVVFGAGGDRDREKRPLMGAAAEAFAHDVIVTSDNPRSEDPAAIIADIVAGMTRPDAAGVEADRRRAIELALSRHGPGDVIVVAGKGHETTQIIGDSVLAFDDRDVVRDVVAAGATG
jgi:UDP-N-acetylmuramoyl-L-alanyl-D-glutamate--2,6-diaminopimelate ligase